jgi:hypothetical protein
MIKVPGSGASCVLASAGSASCSASARAAETSPKRTHAGSRASSGPHSGWPWPGVITPGQPRGPKVCGFHQIPCIYDGEWAGIARPRGPVARPPGPPELASLARTAEHRAAKRPELDGGAGRAPQQRRAGRQAHDLKVKFTGLTQTLGQL